MAEQYIRRNVGDRKDGHRLRTVSPSFLLTPFMMRDPSDAVNSFTDHADTEAMERWVRLRRSEGNDGVSILHVFIAAYVRTLALRPAMNRFVSGRHIFARNSIDVVLSAGRSGAADSGALAVKVRFRPTDTIYDVVRRINSKMNSMQADEDSDRFKKLAAILVKTPRFVVRAGMAVVRWLDTHGWLSEAALEKSPFHGSVVISEEGSYSLPPLERSLNSMGSLPVSLSIGRRRSALELNADGQLVERKYVDYTVSFDSRIADSSYVGSAFKYFRYYLDNPGELEKVPERINDDAL